METAENGGGTGRRIRRAALVGSSCQQSSKQARRYVSHNSTVNDHVAKSQSLFTLYSIFFERDASTATILFRRKLKIQAPRTISLAITGKQSVGQELHSPPGSGFGRRAGIDADLHDPSA